MEQVENKLGQGRNAQKVRELLREAVEGGCELSGYNSYGHLISYRVVQKLTELEKQGKNYWMSWDFGTLTEEQGLTYLSYLEAGEPNSIELGSVYSRVPIHLADNFSGLQELLGDGVCEVLQGSTMYSDRAVYTYYQLCDTMGLDKHTSLHLLRAVMDSYTVIQNPDVFYDYVCSYMWDSEVESVIECIGVWIDAKILDSLKYTDSDSIVAHQGGNSRGYYYEADTQCCKARVGNYYSYLCILTSLYGERLNLLTTGDFVSELISTSYKSLSTVREYMPEFINSIEVLLRRGVSISSSVLQYLWYLVEDVESLSSYIAQLDSVEMYFNMGFSENELLDIVKSIITTESLRKDFETYSILEELGLYYRKE